MKEILIQHMVCPRCVETVETELEKSGLKGDVQLGKVIFEEEPEVDKLKDFIRRLKRHEFQLIVDDETTLIEQVKHELIDLVFYDRKMVSEKLSDHLQKQIGKNYGTISRVFSECTGKTIQDYMIALKIERAKELMQYGKKNISEIADELGYNSLAYFTYQFRKMTGSTPSKFRESSYERQHICDL